MYPLPAPVAMPSNNSREYNKTEGASESRSDKVGVDSPVSGSARTRSGWGWTGGEETRGV